MLSCAILTYHSQNVRGDGQAQNDHAALRENLLALHRAGYRIVSLSRMMDWLDGESGDPLPGHAVALTFDDGCDFDVRDLDYPGHGVQRAFSGILADFTREHGAGAQPELHATTFVIASSEARRIIDAGSLFGQGWISDDWWRETDSSGLVAVESHGWDHNHPDLAGDARGNFHTVDTHEQCLEQVVRAAASIESRTGRWPRFFAYPFGQSSAYIRDTFFPGFTEVHGCRAAFGTEPGKVTEDSNRWNLPRFVCGRDWKSSEELLELVHRDTNL